MFNELKVPVDRANDEAIILKLMLNYFDQDVAGVTTDERTADTKVTVVYEEQRDEAEIFLQTLVDTFDCAYRFLIEQKSLGSAEATIFLEVDTFSIIH